MSNRIVLGRKSVAHRNLHFAIESLTLARVAAHRDAWVAARRNALVTLLRAIDQDVVETK